MSAVILTQSDKSDEDFIKKAEETIKKAGSNFAAIKISNQNCKM